MTRDLIEFIRTQSVSELHQENLRCFPQGIGMLAHREPRKNCRYQSYVLVLKEANVFGDDRLIKRICIVLVSISPDSPWANRVCRCEDFLPSRRRILITTTSPPSRGHCGKHLSSYKPSKIIEILPPSITQRPPGVRARSWPINHRIMEGICSDIAKPTPISTSVDKDMPSAFTRRTHPQAQEQVTLDV